jgi:competence protein ComEA
MRGERRANAGSTSFRIQGMEKMKRIIGLFLALFVYASIAFAAVNINSATKEQLESLNGIGPVKAQAIIDYRKKHGSFKSLEDIKKVDGVGDATFEKIRADISLSGTTKIEAPAKAEPKKEEKKAEAKKEEKKAEAKKEEKKAEPRKETKKAEPKKDEKKAEPKKETKKADKKADDKKAEDKKAEEKKADKK